VARGELTHHVQARIHRAVEAAERSTGLELAVAVTKVPDADTALHARHAFAHHGLHRRPTVMILMSLDHRKVEVVTSADAVALLDDDAAGRVVAAITAAMAHDGVAHAIEAGLAVLVDQVQAARPPSEADAKPQA
jgi:uncharacterized membrane protein